MLEDLQARIEQVSRFGPEYAAAESDLVRRCEEKSIQYLPVYRALTGLFSFDYDKRTPPAEGDEFVIGFRRWCESRRQSKYAAALDMLRRIYAEPSEDRDRQAHLAYIGVIERDIDDAHIMKLIEDRDFYESLGNATPEERKKCEQRIRRNHNMSGLSQVTERVDEHLSKLDFMKHLEPASDRKVIDLSQQSILHKKKEDLIYSLGQIEKMIAYRDQLIGRIGSQDWYFRLG